jgi:hypothetical protein
MKSKDEYLFCQKHQIAFVKGYFCPDCSKKRTIYDDWEPSYQENPEPRLPEPEIIPLPSGHGCNDRYAAMWMECDMIPTAKTYKCHKCEKHNMMYVEGLSECPECVDAKFLEDIANMSGE